jgi:hypothetical protein
MSRGRGPKASANPNLLEVALARGRSVSGGGGGDSFIFTPGAPRSDSPSNVRRSRDHRVLVDKLLSFQTLALDMASVPSHRIRSSQV